VALKDALVEESSLLSDVVEDVASVSQETAAGAEEMSATTEEVSQAASELKDLSGGLEHAVSAFKVEKSDPEGKPHLRVAA
jgi:methyl-accepting chemotaxis protein